MSAVKPSSQQQRNSIDARILEVMNSIFPQFKCSMTDLKFPKKEFVIKFYWMALEELQFDVTKLTQGPLAKQLEGNSDPELFADSFQLINLSRALRVILSKLQKGDAHRFGLQDLVDPNAHRNSAFMFSLLNFLTFADARMVELTSKVELIAKRKSELTKLLKRREEVSRQVNHRATVKAKRQDCSKEMKLKRALIDELRKESNSLEELSNKKSAERENVKRRIERVQNNLSQLKITLAQLEAQQVSSPDVLQKTQRNSQKQLEEITQQLEQAQQTAKEKKKVIKLFEALEKDQDLRLALLTDFVKGSKSLQDLDEQLADLQAKLKAELEDKEAIQADLNGLKKDLSHLMAQLTNSQLQWKKNQGSMKENIRHLSEEGKILELEQGKEMEVAVQEIEQLQTEVNDLIDKNNQFNVQCEKMYADLLEKETMFVASKNAEFDAAIAKLENAKRK